MLVPFFINILRKVAENTLQAKRATTEGYSRQAAKGINTLKVINILQINFFILKPFSNLVLNLMG